MGQQYAFSCPGCGYTNEHCGGGTEYGMAMALSTIHCKDCTELYDVPTYEFGFTPGEIPALCPKNKRHVVSVWVHPGPCPKCGIVLHRAGMSGL